VVQVQAKTNCYEKAKQKNRNYRRSLMFDNSASVFENNSFKVSAVFRQKNLEPNLLKENSRNKEICDLMRSGLSTKEIGLRYKITAARVRKIASKVKKKQKDFFYQQMEPVQNMLNLFQEIFKEDAKQSQPRRTKTPRSTATPSPTRPSR
jgi:hypothetical protein